MAILFSYPVIVHQFPCGLPPCRSAKLLPLLDAKGAQVIVAGEFLDRPVRAIFFWGFGLGRHVGAKERVRDCSWNSQVGKNSVRSVSLPQGDPQIFPCRSSLRSLGT